MGWSKQKEVSMFIWAYVLVFFASFFKSCADTFENSPNFNESIFKGWNKKFWCKDVSWDYAKVLSIKIPFIKKRIGSYKLDSWHLSMSAMIICWVGAVCVFRTHHQWWVHFISMGLIWNATFWLFYHKIFQVK